MLEEYISNLLNQKGIDTKDKLNVNDLSDAFNIGVVYCEQSSKIIPYRNRYFIVLDSRTDEMRQYEDFLHELSHFILEIYNFNGLYSYKSIERRINHIVQILSCPLHLYEQTNDIREMSIKFNMSYRLAEKRIKRIKLKKK